MSKDETAIIVQMLVEFKGEMNTALEHVQGEIEHSRIETITEVQKLEIKLSDKIGNNKTGIAVLNKGQSAHGRELSEIKKRCDTVQLNKSKRTSIIPAKATSMLDVIKGYGALIIGVLTVVGGVIVAFFSLKK